MNDLRRLTLPLLTILSVGCGAGTLPESSRKNECPPPERPPESLDLVLATHRDGPPSTVVEGSEPDGHVLGALRWLARHQSMDGAWRVNGHTKLCAKNPSGKKSRSCETVEGASGYDAGITALAVLSFLSAGYTSRSEVTRDGKRFGTVIARGLDWIGKTQTSDGRLGGPEAPKMMYTHAVCTLALTEAHRMDRSERFRKQAQKAIDFTVRARNPGGVWRYGPRSGSNDSSVTGWVLLGLHSAEKAGLVFPKRQVWTDVRTWYDRMTGGTYYRTGYNHPNTGKVFDRGRNEHFSHHETMSAISVTARLLMDPSLARRRPANRYVRGGRQHLMRDLPLWEEKEIDYYYWFWGTSAIHLADDPKRSARKPWDEALAAALLNHQWRVEGECREGSWDPIGRWCHTGGRVFATAINTLTLLTNERFARMGR